MISRAILVHNRGRAGHLADGIVITPSHNPPQDGGFKYNATHGGPADTDVTQWVERRANDLGDLAEQPAAVVSGARRPACGSQRLCAMLGTAVPLNPVISLNPMESGE